MPPSPITLWQVILFVMLFVLSTQKVRLIHSLYIANCIETTLVFQRYFIYTNLQYVPQFDCLILPDTFLCHFLLVFWLATLAFMFPAIYLVLGLISVCIFKSSILVFLQKLCFLVFIKLILCVMHI